MYFANTIYVCVRQTTFGMIKKFKEILTQRDFNEKVELKDILATSLLFFKLAFLMVSMYFYVSI
ncbi:hypothetical protein LCGC14_1115280 [marine sediment metagenome]|uniref:Uncharacterized protein n=1 Tax=marine sediment metagenome TaxID=412755 RepID=A0A0F9QBC2_9ZZZZ